MVREPIQQMNRWRHSSDRLHHLNLLWNSWRRACVKARPTTWAPTIMIWAINLAWREILWSLLVKQKHQATAESQNTHHFKEKSIDLCNTRCFRHLVQRLLVPRSSHLTEGSEELGLDRENKMVAKSASLGKKPKSAFKQAFPLGYTFRSIAQRM